MPEYNFEFDAHAVIALGRESIRDAATAVLELVKNSYDAGADVARVIISGESITIQDNGDGMTSKKVIASWLRIGASEKIKHPYTAKGRRKIGEKGVGRLSADRLGSHLRLRSQSKRAGPCEVIVDWKKFEEADDVLAVPIMVETEDIERFDVPVYIDGGSDSGCRSNNNSRRHTGTELYISKLREKWDDDEIDDLRSKLGTILSPFSSERFQVQLTVGGSTSVLENPLADSGQAYFFCRIDSAYTKDGKKKKKLLVEYREWFGTAEDAEDGKADVHQLFFGEVGLNDIRNSGPIELHLTYIPKTKDVALSAGFSVVQLGRHLKENAGVRVYRDGVRVYPYGDPKRPDGDWLRLAQRKAASPDAITRKAFKIPPNRLIGAVQISRDQNAELIDVSGREGLMHNDAYRAMRTILLAALKHLEQLIVRNNPEVPDDGEALTPRQAAKNLSKRLGALTTDISNAENTLRSLPAKKRREVKQLELSLATTKNDVQAFGETVDKLIDENSLWRSLATIGIASTTFSHETLGHIQGAFTSSTVAREALKVEDGDYGVAIDALARSIEHIKSVEAWGTFALKRIKKDKRKHRNVEIDDIVKTVIRDLKNVTDITNIRVEQKIRSKSRVRGFAMDIESIFLNLLTNAFYFCRKGGRDSWMIRISTSKKAFKGREGVLISVADTGPGVNAKDRKSIWEPLVSTKVDCEGTGLGLAIVSAVVDDYQGTRSVSSDAEIHGALFEVWLPAA